VVGTAAALVLVLVLAACGGGGDGDADGGGGDGEPGADVTIEAEGPPTTGGSLSYALEAESDGFDPTENRWAISGTMIGLAVFDPLVAYDADSEPQPYLAESMTPNADHTQWTFKLRSGVTFSDGTPLTSEAVKRAMEAHLQSVLTKPTLAPLVRVETPDPLTAVFVMNTPWVAFPASLTGQTGVVPAPSMLDDPDGSRHPIGTGPFVQQEWIPDSRWVGTKNPNYWRTDDAGTQLPYLDEVVFRPIPDNQVRVRALQTGDVDMVQTSDPGSVEALRLDAAAGSSQLVQDRGEGEEGFLMLNTSKPPFDDLNARLAVAHAIDRQAYTDVATLGINPPADNLFTASSRYRVDVDFPAYDVAESQRYAQAYSDAHGGEPLRFTIGNTPPTGAVNTAEQIQQQLAAAGIQADVRYEEQSTFIASAVTGNYQANMWRQFGSPDPDFDSVWWYSANAEGGLTLNIARHKDPRIDAALDKGRQNADPAVRKDAYAELQRLFAETVPYVWLDHSTWVVGASNDVRGITNGPLPDGKPSLPMGGANGFGAATRLTMTWLAR
jgi:peptide/nickel transport system substrate-binding protein